MLLARMISSSLLVFLVPLTPGFAEEPALLSEASCGKLTDLYTKFTQPVACSTVRNASPKKMGETFKEDYSLYNEYCVSCDYLRLKRPDYSDLDIALRELPNDRDLTAEEIELLRQTYINDIKGLGKSSNATTAQNVSGLILSGNSIPGDARSPVTVNSLISVGISEDDARLLIQQIHNEMKNDFESLSLSRGEMMDAMGKANNAITIGKNSEKAPACLNLLRARQKYFDSPSPSVESASKKKSKKKASDEERVGLKQIAQKSWSTLVASAFDHGCKGTFVKQWCSNVGNPELRTACEVRMNLLDGKTDATEILAQFKTNAQNRKASPSSAASATVEKPAAPKTPGAPAQAGSSKSDASQDPNKK